VTTDSSIDSTADSSATTIDAADGDAIGGGRHDRRRRWLAACGVTALVIAGAIAAGADGVFSNSPASPTQGVTPPALATITQGSLSSETNVSGTLGYAGHYNVINEAAGFFTSLPSPGQTIQQGSVLYRISDGPVVLLYGSVPAYRPLTQGLTGNDVLQLNADLVALGYATRSELSPTSNYFGSATTTAVEKLQDHLGVTQNGTLKLSQFVFLPSEARISAVNASVGSPAGMGMPVLSATSTTRQITVNLQATEQSYVAAGDKVTITLANNSTTTGVVTSVGNVATSSGSGTPTVTVEITPLHPAAVGSLDAEPVQVAITTASVSDALAVPVTALLVVPGTGYEVQVAGSAGHYRTVPVSLGLFDDAAGLVQITGPGLYAGERVTEAQ
jgi:peptidoglycan hydrolase-like protein with peptidoglycan-binding domain